MEVPKHRRSRWAKPGFAYAAMGTLGGFRVALGTASPPCHPRAPRGLAKPSRAMAEPRGARPKDASGRAGRWRSRSTDEVGGRSPASPTRSWEPWEGSALHSAPPAHPATPALRAASPNPPALWRSREGRVRRTRAGGRGGGGPEAPTKSVGEARLRLRGHGNPDLKPPRPAKRGEVAERSEAGEGLSRFTPE